MTAVTGIGVDDVLAATLEPLGPWPPGVEPLSGSPVAAGLELTNDGHVEVGIWECTPGAYASRRDGTCELMHVVAGAGEVTDEDGTVHELRPGTALFLPDGWRGTFTIRETVRKTYVSVRVRDAPQP